MSRLQLLLLGHFDCLLPSGQRISLSMRKAEVLLAYLALALRVGYQVMPALGHILAVPARFEKLNT